MTSDYRILIMNSSMQVVGDPVDCWTTVDATLRYNEPGSGLFTCPGYSWIRDQLAPGRRAVLTRSPPAATGQPGSILISGPLEKWLYERSDNGENAGDGVLTVNFADDLASVLARRVYPDPALAAEAQTATEWSFTGNAEDAIRELVNKNAGPGALVERRVPNLILGADNGVGTSGTWKAELFEPMGDVLRRIAETGGGLGFRTRQIDNQIVFEVYQPTDASDTVRFSFEMANVQYLAYEVVAPTANVAFVGGQGDTAEDQAVIERTNPDSIAAWGRMETLVSRPGSGEAEELEADGDEALRDGAETARAPSNVVDLNDQMYGTHYDLGTKVALSPYPGTQIVDVVRTVHLQAWATAGDMVAPVVGAQEESGDPYTIQLLRSIDRRVGRLERSVVSAAPTAP